MSGRDIKGIELENKVRAIVDQALSTMAYEPAEVSTIMNARAIISRGMSSLKTRGVIKGYRIDMELQGTKIFGNVTYSPIRVIDDVVIGISTEHNNSFTRAMKGI